MMVIKVYHFHVIRVDLDVLWIFASVTGIKMLKFL